jgi:hypothetical protein
MVALPPRRVRIARPPPAPPPPSSPAPEPSAELPFGSREAVRRANRAGVQRVRRLTIVYVVGLAAIYLALALLSRSGPAGASPGAARDLELVGGIALALALGGAMLTLLSAPTAVERWGSEMVFVSAVGTRRRIPIDGRLSVRVLRRYPAGWLADAPVESTEVAVGTRRRTYLLEPGLVAATEDPAR